MKSRFCKLDDRCDLSFELHDVDGQTFMTIIDRKHTHKDTPYQAFANVTTYVDKYRLLQLADYIYEYCMEK